MTARLTMHELLTVAGAAAMRYPDGWRSDGDGAYAVIPASELDFVRRRTVRLTHMDNGDIRIDVEPRGGPAKSPAAAEAGEEAWE